MNAKVKSRLSSLVKLLVAVGIFAWLISSGRLDLRSAFALFHSPLFFVGFALVGLSLLLASERWRLLVAPQDVTARAGDVFRLSLIGTFFNFAMPGGVGGDVVKAYYFGKDHPHARAAAITSVILDRALGLYAMIFMALAAMIADLTHVLSTPTLMSLMALMVTLWFGVSILFVLLFSRRFKKAGWLTTLLEKLPLSQKLLKLYDTAHRFGLDRKRVLMVLGLSFVAQAVSILFLWVAGRASGFGDVPLLTYFFVAPIGFMATAIPISPAGVGVGQAAFYALFNMYLHTETGIGPAVITAHQAMTVLFGLIGAWFYVQRGEPAPTAPSEETT